MRNPAIVCCETIRGYIPSIRTGCHEHFFCRCPNLPHDGITTRNYLLRAIEYHVTYGALLDGAFLPPSTKSIGPFYHVNQEFETVEGLTVPVQYSVHGKTGSRSITGVVQSWSFRKTFDETMMSRPPDATLDTSNARRRGD